MMDERLTLDVRHATLGGGCFWCLEAVFERVEGVSSVVSGYAGGHDPRPTYEAVCGGTTGHAEVVRIAYDPAVVPYDRLLDVFFTIHDPTTPGRQGHDVGDQYRSIVLAEDESDERAARAKIAELTRRGVFDAPVVTEVDRLVEFFPAEPHHQGYYRRNPGAGYCRAVIAPKLAELRASWAELLRPA